MAQFALRPLKPGVLLMRRLRVPGKLTVMGLVLLVPLLMLAVTMFLSTRDEAATSSLELDSAQQISRLVGLVARLKEHREPAAADRTQLDAEIKALAAAIDANPLTVDAKAWAETRQSLADLLEGRAPTQAAELLAFHNRVIEQVQRQMRLADVLATQLEQRMKDKASQFKLVVGLWSLAMLVLVYFALSFYVSFAGAIRSLHRGVDKVLAGDLSQHIVVHGGDEVAEIGAMVERMNERMSALVAEIRSSAVRVTMSGETVAAGSQSLASRTEQQASSLRQTVITVKQLSTAVAANAAEANELDRLTAQLRDQAEAGGEQMRASVGEMSQLEDSSRRVAEIIGVIDGIAFQTNILALNAAVEAARAGEAGRGFAVVASEVRQLAQRSAAAAAEIRTLIASSSAQVDTSVKRTRRVGDALASVVDGVRKVSASLQAIAQASARQSTDLQEVTQSVGNLDEITRQNAEMVEQSAQAAGDLVTRAGALRESVATIRLRQGSADEARELVGRALEIVKQRGLDGARAQLSSREDGFVDRDLYVFGVDRDGRYIVHGSKPQMVGRLIHEVPGIDGDRFVREAWEAALSNGGRGGWVEYNIINPESGAVQPKATFAVALDDRNLIGCGVYRVG